MKTISILDCTLRDGGRIIDCKFNDNIIIGIGKQLKRAGINIIEMGFLRNQVKYSGNSTFFSSVQDANQYIQQIYVNDQRKDEKYVLFMDYGLYNVANLDKADYLGISGIRYGFTKKDYCTSLKEIVSEMKQIKDKGYDLYFQDVNTNGYEKDEIIKLISIANEVGPVSFGIVDTYGSMYLDELENLWNIVDYYLDKSIAIDFHSHNNMQLSFALTQRLIQLVNNNRKLIIDSTLNGMGKCAGNLNTELIVDFLSRKYNYGYNLDIVLDTIDQYLFSLKKQVSWGYSIAAFMAGVYKAHPNNIIYLTEKYRLNSKDIKYIISAIDEKTRQKYDYNNIEKIYKEYCSNKINDTYTVDKLRTLFMGKKVLVLVSGRTIKKYYDRIIQYIRKEKPIVLSVNFIPENISCDYLFYANTIHWEKISDIIEHNKCIVTSNIHVDIANTYLVDYSSLIVEDSALYDNSTIMLLNLLKNIEVKEIKLAGFDGLKEKGKNYIDDTFPNDKVNIEYKEINLEIKKLLEQYKNKVVGNIKIEFLTPSIYEE